MKILKCLLMIVTAPVILVLTLFCLALHGSDSTYPVWCLVCSAL